MRWHAWHWGSCPATRPGSLHLAAVALFSSAVLAIAACGGDEGTSSSDVQGGDPGRGREVAAAAGCGACHSIPGVDGADAVVAPPLDGFSERAYIAGVLPNQPEELVRWLLDPQSVDPDTAMPNVGLGGQEARDVAAYLRTLGS